MGWTEKKFSAFNLAFLRRQVVESMENRKNSIISGLYANTNLDDGKGTRQKMIQDIDNNFKEAIAELYDPQPEVKIDSSNEFFGAMNVPGGDVDWKEYAKNNPSANNLTNLDDDIEVDQT